MNTTDTESRTDSRRALREGALVLTVLACLPYLALKTAWVLGSDVGIPADSVLHDRPGTMMFANGLSMVMELTAVVLAFVLARPWGRRVPAWLVAGPAWIATGLLAPIVLAFPLETLLGVASGSSEPPAEFLEPWVFTLVYGGFSLQALGLGTLFVLHAVSRWGHLWRGSVAGLPVLAASPAARLSVVGAVVVAATPLVGFVAWTAGSSWLRGEPLPDSQVPVQGVFAVLTVAALWGAAVLVRGRSTMPAWQPFAAAWVGSATLGAWGLWMMVGTGLMGSDTPPVLVVAFGLAAASGAMLLVTGAHLLAGWAGVRAMPGERSVAA